MAEQVRVVVDAMGGDNAPAEPVKAAVEAVTERQDIKVILTGKQDVIEGELAKYSGYPTEQIQVVPASEVIETAEPPVFAIRKKKDSSIVVGLKLVKTQEADAFVSSGSTGAVLVGGQVLVGRSKGVERPPLAPLIPTTKGVPADRLWRKCGRTSLSSGTVRKDGIHLYGECSGNQKSKGGHC